MANQLRASTGRSSITGHAYAVDPEGDRPKCLCKKGRMGLSIFQGEPKWRWEN